MHITLIPIPVNIIIISLNTILFSPKFESIDIKLVTIFTTLEADINVLFSLRYLIKDIILYSTEEKCKSKVKKISREIRKSTN